VSECTHSKPVHLASVDRSPGVSIKIRRIERGGVSLIDLRVFDAAGFPTKAGFDLPADELSDLVEALKAVSSAGALAGGAA
jgi:hypothetical protein